MPLHQGHWFGFSQGLRFSSDYRCYLNIQPCRSKKYCPLILDYLCLQVRGLVWNCPLHNPNLFVSRFHHQGLSGCAMSSFLSLDTGSEGLKQRLVNRQWMSQVFSSGILCWLFFQRKAWCSGLHKCLHTTNLSEHFSLSFHCQFLSQRFRKSFLVVSVLSSSVKAVLGVLWPVLMKCVPAHTQLLWESLFFFVSLSVWVPCPAVSLSQQLRNQERLSTFCSDDLFFSVSKEKMQKKTFCWVLWPFWE